MMRKSLAFLLVGCICFIDLLVGAKTDEAASKWARQIKAINKSEGSIDIFWINTETDESHLMAEAVENGMDLLVESFVGQSFEFRESPDPDTGLCSASGSHDHFFRANRFTVTEDDVNLQSKSRAY
jgi:hypothetical protein